MEKVFDQPTSEMAFAVPCQQAFVLKQARAGAIGSKRLSNGTYLFSAHDVDVLRRLKAESIARRYSRAA